jgi:hypothetical protein
MATNEAKIFDGEQLKVTEAALKALGSLSMCEKFGGLGYASAKQMPEQAIEAGVEIALSNDDWREQLAAKMSYLKADISNGLDQYDGLIDPEDLALLENPELTDEGFRELLEFYKEWKLDEDMTDAVAFFDSTAELKELSSAGFSREQYIELARLHQAQADTEASITFRKSNIAELEAEIAKYRLQNDELSSEIEALLEGAIEEEN